MTIPVIFFTTGDRVERDKRGASHACGRVGECEADVRQIAERVLEAFRMRMDGKCVRLCLEGGSAPAAVAARRILQVIENLVDNAAGFSREGGRVLIEVGTEGHLTLLRVSDEGPGIPRNMRKGFSTGSSASVPVKTGAGMPGWD